MVSREQIVELFSRKPFQPFRVRLADGRTFDITDPNLGLVSETIFVIGIPDPADPEPVYAVRREWVYYGQIAGIESLPQALKRAI